MNHQPRLEHGTLRLRRHARDVALAATAIAIAISLLVAVVADLLVLGHVQGAIDGRLSARLSSIERLVAPDGEVKTSSLSALAARGIPEPASGDLDDAPIFAWWVPKSDGKPLPLESDAPRFTTPPRVGYTGNTTIAGRPMRIATRQVQGGTLFVATSIAQWQNIRGVLLLVELLLLPILLVGVFVMATLIGRRAATPIERIRREQLDFTADASHELRTPLSVIEAEVGLALARHRTSDEYRLALTRVEGETGRLRRIVEDLLWLARIDSRPERPAAEPVDLASLVAQCAGRFRAVAELGHLELTVSTSEEEELRVRAPAEWLDRLVSVLVDNACRYCGEGGHVRVSAQLVRGRPTLTVEDDGPGIDPDQLRAVMRRFHRASAVAGGAGLGLAIADNIVDASGGRWELSDHPTRGSRFQVSWPAEGRTIGWGRMKRAANAQAGGDSA